MNKDFRNFTLIQRQFIIWLIPQLENHTTDEQIQKWMGRPEITIDILLTILKEDVTYGRYLIFSSDIYNKLRDLFEKRFLIQHHAKPKR